MSFPFATVLHSFLLYSLQDPGRFEVPVLLKEALPEVDAPIPSSKAQRLSSEEASPAGVADDLDRLASALGGSTATYSQPNSATSSLAGLFLDADLLVASRQSSGSDLTTLYNTRPGNSRHSSQDGSLSARSDVSHKSAVEAITAFDCGKCKALAKVKVLAVTTPNNEMVPAYQNSHGAEIPGLTIRPTRLVTNRLPQPGTNYNLSALLAEFKMKKASSVSPVAGAKPPPPQWGPDGAGACPVEAENKHRNSSSTITPLALRKSTMPHPHIPSPSPPRDDEPRSMVMIPGMRRRT